MPTFSDPRQQLRKPALFAGLCDPRQLLEWPSLSVTLPTSGRPFSSASTAALLLIETVPALICPLCTAQGLRHMWRAGYVHLCACKSDCRQWTQ